MSTQARMELLVNLREQYQESNGKAKKKVLDGFIAATGYDRKYACSLLKSKKALLVSREKRNSSKITIYGEDVCQALITIWYAANQIC